MVSRTVYGIADGEPRQICTLCFCSTPYGSDTYVMSRGDGKTYVCVSCFEKAQELFQRERGNDKFGNKLDIKESDPEIQWYP